MGLAMGVAVELVLGEGEGEGDGVEKVKEKPPARPPLELALAPILELLPELPAAILPAPALGALGTGEDFKNAGMGLAVVDGSVGGKLIGFGTGIHRARRSLIPVTDSGASMGLEDGFLGTPAGLALSI